MEREIMGRRITDEGEYIDEHVLRISDMGPEGNEDLGASEPDVVYNKTKGEFLVTWRGKNKQVQGNEIFIQRVDAGSGDETGENDRKISSMGSNDSGHWSYSPAIAWNSTDNEYLAVWEGSDDRVTLADKEVEVFGQRIDKNGQEEGENDFRISIASEARQTPHFLASFRRLPRRYRSSQ